MSIIGHRRMERGRGPDNYYSYWTKNMRWAGDKATAWYFIVSAGVELLTQPRSLTAHVRPTCTLHPHIQVIKAVPSTSYHYGTEEST